MIVPGFALFFCEVVAPSAGLLFCAVLAGKLDSVPVPPGARAVFLCAHGRHGISHTQALGCGSHLRYHF